MKNRLKVNRTLKMSIMVVLSCLILLLGYTTINLKNKQKYEESIQTTYQHSWQENIEWTSHLIDNPIISEKTLDKTRFLFKDFTDKIAVKFEVPVKTSEKVNFEGDAFIKATLKSVYGEKDELVWEQVKSFNKVEIESDDHSINFIGKAENDIMAIKTFLTSLGENYTISGNYVFIYELFIDGMLVGESGTYDFKIKPTVEFALMNNLAKGIEEKSATLDYKEEETVQVLIPVNQNQLNFYYVIMGLLVIVIVLFLVLTVSKDTKDAFDRLVDSMLKEYGDRMVEIPKSLSLQYGNIMNIENEKDMIKTADEINQPVFYYYNNTDEERKLEMFVFDDVRVYYYSKFGVVE